VRLKGIAEVAMWVLGFAWRNLWRNRRRTLITVSSIAFGLVLAVVFTGLADGTYSTMIDSAVKLGAGHVTLEHKDFRRSLSSRLVLSDVETLSGALGGSMGVASWTPRIVGQALLSTSYGNVGAGLMAVDPQRERGMSLFTRKLVEGKYLNDVSGRGAILGVKMAEKLKVSVGSKVVVTANDRHGEIAAELLRVEGIFKTGSEMLDGYVFQLPLGRARRLLGLNDSEVTQIAVFLEDQRGTDAVVGELREELASFGNVAVLPWREVMPELASYIEIDKASNYIFEAIVLVIIAAGILNTLLMSVLERRYEFGVILCLGLKPSSLLFIILLESAYIGLLGVSAGLMVGLAINRYFIVSGFDMNWFMDGEIDISGVVLDPILYADLSGAHLFYIVALVFVLTLLAGVYPSVKAARSVPVEILRKGR
jgi:ABC-type lipoprotein release transport system permease subunit